MNAHARFSPSSSERWLQCPGSVPLIERLEKTGTIPADTGSSYSEEGTAAHWLLAWCLRKGLSVPDFIAKKVKGFPVRAFAGKVQDAVDYVRKRELLSGAKAFSELEVPIPSIRGHGTIDVRVLSATTLHIMDYKNGSGVEVQAEESTQLGLYATGTDEWKRVERVFLHVIQPEFGDPKVWRAPGKWLSDLETRARAAIKNANSAKPKLSPSPEACRWCRAKPFCPALAKSAATAARQEWKDVIVPVRAKEVQAPPSVKGLSLDQLAAIHSRRKMISDFLDAVETALRDAIIRRGKRVTGFKLVEGRSSRQWANEKRIRKALVKLKLSPELFNPRKLLGLGAMEALLRSEAGFSANELETFMDMHTLRQSGPPTLVPASDKRLEYKPSDAKADWKDEL